METTTNPPPGTIFCLFCKGVVNVKDDNWEKFKKHMEDVHEIYYEHEFILAGSFLKKEEKDNIIAAAKGRIRKSRDTRNGKPDEILIAEDVSEVKDNNVEISFESATLAESNVVTLRAVHYGNGDSDDEDMTHTYKIAESDKEIDGSDNQKDIFFFKEEIPKIKNPRSYKCEKCNKQFVNSRKLKIHKMNFMNKDCAKIKASCDLCRKSFKSRQILNVHKFKGNCQPV